MGCPGPPRRLSNGIYAEIIALHAGQETFKITEYRYSDFSGGIRMIYSRSAEYAIRAFVHLAQVPDGKYAMVKNIAQTEDIPAHFLAKILQQLARKGLLRSSKGPTGGFALRIDASEIRLLDIVEALDGLAPYQQCASGLSECSDDMPCSMHDSWVTLRSRIMDYLGRNTIADLAKALDQKKKSLALAKQRKSRRAVAAKRA